MLIKVTIQVCYCIMINHEQYAFNILHSVFLQDTFYLEYLHYY